MGRVAGDGSHPVPIRGEDRVDDGGSVTPVEGEDRPRDVGLRLFRLERRGLLILEENTDPDE